MKISFLVAVFNTENWIRRCLDSLLSQSYPNIEIICVNDGSTDGSLNILQEYAAKDNRIIVLSWKANRGPSKSRNAAFAASTGDWVAMIDSDDWLEVDAVKKVMRLLEDRPTIDSVLFKVLYHDEQTGSQREFVNKTTSKTILGKNAMILALDWDIHGFYIAKRELYDLYPYDETTLLYSDDNTARVHYLHSREVALSDGIYFYFQHARSMTHSPGIRFADWMEATQSLRQMLIDEKQDEYLICKMEKRLWENIIAVCGYYFREGKKLSANEREKLRRRIKNQQQRIDVKRLPQSYRWKFGFMPLKWNFTLFMLQERVYFYLRYLIKGI